MRKKETLPTLLYCISDKKVKELVDDYIDYVMNPYHEWRQSTEWRNRKDTYIIRKGQERPKAEEPEKRPLKQRDEFDNRRPIYKLEHKPNRDRTEFCFRALIDMIYRKYETSNEDSFNLNKSILSTVFGEGYQYMMVALSEKSIIQTDDNPIKLVHPEWFSCDAYKYAKSVLPYKKKVYDAIKQYRKKHQIGERTEALISSMGKVSEFLEQYEKNVSLISFTDEDGLKAYMEDDTHFKSERAKMVVQAFVDRVNLRNGYMLEDKSIVSKGRNEDENHIGRFYHIGTSMKKELKKFTNLQYGIDAHNSHPLLFNYFLLNYYFNNNSLLDIYTNFLSISNNNIFYLISNYLFNNPISNNTYHYVSESLCKSLKDNNIIQEDIEKVKKIPFDVLRYIQDTSTGVIWDNVQKQFPKYTRGQIKQLMFQYVFYSYATRKSYYDFRSRTTITLERKEWVDAFETCYPSVMKLINKYKKEFKKQCKKDLLVDKDDKEKIQLPHLLMRFESVIFTRSLFDAFKAKIPAIGIHDCIAVIGGNVIDEKQQQEVKQIILDRYKEVGITPALAIENYHTKQILS